MKYHIDQIRKEEYIAVVNLWEASVRATHHFLKEEDINYFKPLILSTYLDAVDLRCIRNKMHEILGFLGTAAQHLEMLFIAPECRGKGIGKALLTYAIAEMDVLFVDVNEQNEQALEFYTHFGFQKIGRSDLDATGKPYPIVHMALNSGKKTEVHNG